MPFSNQIVAGSQGSLIRNSIQSPNYVAGVSGWQIRKDGSVEFNNGTFRGSLTSGTNPGQHIVLNNGVTGDAVDVYDSMNRLVLDISNIGILQTISQPTQDTAQLQGNALTWRNLLTPPFSFPGIVATGKSTGTFILIDSGHGTNTSTSSNIEPLDSITSSNAKSYVRVQQNGNGTTIPLDIGSIVQTDTDNSSNNVIHFFHGATTVVDLGGGFLGARFNHGANFTPVGQMLVPFDGGSVTQLFTYNQETTSATQAVVSVRHADGTVAVVGENTECYGVVWK